MMEDRHQKILEILADSGQSTVAEMSEYFAVSSVTIRVDLNHLAEIGKVIRTHGGARLAGERMRQEQTYATRQRINADEKRCIGKSAAELVLSNDAILLDSSTTAVAVGIALKQRTDLEDITVVTTGIWTALELLGAPHFQVILAGGQVRDTTGSITGLFTEEILSRFNFSKVFLGAWGISFADGFTDTHLAEVELKRKMMARSNQVYIVADGTKFGQVGLTAFASLDQIDGIITDASAPVDMIRALKDHDINVTITCE
jgi:DeoR family transcriptional regulator, aga operon transcriptional repressor